MKNRTTFTMRQTHIQTLTDLLKCILFEHLLVPYLSVDELMRLKLCNKEFKKTISNNTRLEKYYYSRLYYKIITTTVKENGLRAPTVSPTLNTLHTMQRDYPRRRSTPLSDNCNINCTWKNQTLLCIDALYHEHTREARAIETTFTGCPISINSRVMRYHQKSKYIIVYHTHVQSNHWLLPCTRKKLKHYLLHDSYDLIKITTKKAFIQLKDGNKGLNTICCFNENWYTTLLTDFHLELIFNNIPSKYRNNYLITGYPVITYALKQLNYQRNIKTEINIYSFGITYGQHVHNIAHLLSSLSRNNSTKLLFTQKNHKHVQTFMFSFNGQKITIRFIYTKPTTTIHDIITSPGSSIQQFGITINKMLHYSELWLFTFNTRIVFYFAAWFNHYYMSQHIIQQYINAGMKKWLIPKTFSKTLNYKVDLLLQSPEFPLSINETIHLHLKLISKTIKTNWDSDKILLKLIKRIITVYIRRSKKGVEFKQDSTNQNNTDIILKDVTEYINRYTMKCVCFS